jgi:antitoxin (DNA-binding transcriptional repressor) of toxin-antitoxin stability system
VLVTRHGKPVAAIVPVDADALEDHLLATAPGLLADFADADAALAEGTTRPAADVFAELDDTD